MQRSKAHNEKSKENTGEDSTDGRKRKREGDDTDDVAKKLRDSDEAGDVTGVKKPLGQNANSKLANFAFNKEDS